MEVSYTYTIFAGYLTKVVALVAALLPIAILAATKPINANDASGIPTASGTVGDPVATVGTTQVPLTHYVEFSQVPLQLSVAFY